MDFDTIQAPEDGHLLSRLVTPLARAQLEPGRVVMDRVANIRWQATACSEWACSARGLRLSRRRRPRLFKR
jgi:hypothetical protein